MWRPRLRPGANPVYQALVEALAEDVQAGRLQAGERLPPQRELADALGLAVTTVSRAYAEAQRRGLVAGEVGRGTFVRPSAFAPSLRDPGPATVDLSLNTILPHAHTQAIVKQWASVATQEHPDELLGYPPSAGALVHRAAGADWLTRAGVPSSPGEVVLTAGAQHAMSVVFGALAGPGDAVLTEDLTYMGMRSLASQLHVNLVGVPMDEHGLVAAAVERAARRSRARLLYCMPSLQNPTGRVMPASRRRTIAELAARLDLTIIEDDTYGFLVPDVPPLASYALDRTCYIASLSKSLVPGLRLGYLRAPVAMIARLTTAVFATTVCATPFMAAAATAMIGGGMAAEIVAWKRREVRARRTITRRILKGSVSGSHPMSPHLWLERPGVGPEDLVRELRVRGVLATAGPQFAVSAGARANAIRLCLGAPHDRATLESALRIVLETLGETPRSLDAVI